MPLDHDLPLDPDAATDPDAPRLASNGELARIFHEIGDMLEVKGELVFKTVAYHRAADAIGRAPFDVVAPTRTAIGRRSPVSARPSRQDRRARHDREDGGLRAAPRGDSTVARGDAADPGPRSAHRPPDLRGLHIDTVEDLRQAAEAGTLRTSRAVATDRDAHPRGDRAAGVAAPPPAPHQARRSSTSVVGAFEGTPGLRRVEHAGSFRRRKETIGDLDLLAETDDPAPLMARFTGLGPSRR